MRGLTLIDSNVFSKDKVNELWKHLLTQNYWFDDTTEGDSGAFLSMLLAPNNRCYIMGDMQGLILVQGIQPKVGASIHFAHWGDIPITTLKVYALELISTLFKEFELPRITVTLPSINKEAKRVAVLLGFKSEGVLRKAYLRNGQYHDILIFGLLKEEFEEIRRILWVAQPAVQQEPLL